MTNKSQTVEPIVNGDQDYRFSNLMTVTDDS